MPRKPAVYILAGERNGTPYIGVTGNLIQRMWQHKQDLVDGFTKKYKVHVLGCFEFYQTMVETIRGEKQIKKWDRGRKLRLIEQHNPYWRDLFLDINL
jgi:putative endonuclease